MLLRGPFQASSAVASPSSRCESSWAAGLILGSGQQNASQYHHQNPIQYERSKQRCERQQRCGARVRLAHWARPCASAGTLFYPARCTSSNNVIQAVNPHFHSASCGTQEQDEELVTFDILGIAQSMVDVTTDDSIDEDLLETLRVEKGGRRVLGSVAERMQVLDILEIAGSETTITPGGSLANTLVGIARLSAAAATRAAAVSRRGFPSVPSLSTPASLNVGLGTSCSSDALGQFFASHLDSAGVAVVPMHADSCPSALTGHTGTVFVLSSPDAQRSFLSFFSSDPLKISSKLRAAVTRSRLVVVEGYLWELPNADATIFDIVAAARASGAQVALTAADTGVVARHRQKILQVLESGGQDILFFANREEALELLGLPSMGEPGADPDPTARSARSAVAQLGSMCAVAVVTDGQYGSHVACMGRVASLPPAPAPLGVQDTCGAGDAYAAGFCYALMTGHDCVAAGTFASRVAVRVISRHGAQLTEDDASELISLLPQLSPSEHLQRWLRNSTLLLNTHFHTQGSADNQWGVAAC